MSMFGFYFVTNLLERAGWPRKKGLFGGLAYDTLIVDMTIDQMLAWSASLAAGRPELSLRMIAEMFREKDWEGPNSPDIAGVIDGSRSGWDKNPNGSPAEVIQPWRLSDSSGKSIPAKQLADRKIVTALEQLWLEAIMWGLGNPKRVTDWYLKHQQQAHASINDAQRAGLQIEAPPELSDWFEQCASILSAYERDIQPIAKVPRRLRQDAENVGVAFN